MASAAPPRPIVLLAENKTASLKLRERLFERFGCITMGVTSSRDAVRELASTPLVDLLVTDIHMSPDDDDDDKSGLELAQYVRTTWGSDLPLAGYSAHFGEADLERSEWKVFDLHFARGRQGMDELERQVKECVGLAQEHRSRRASDFDDVLEGLRRRYESRKRERELIGRLKGNPIGEIEIQEGPLSVAGYRLRLMTEIDGQSLRSPFLVWILSTDSGAEAEVFGYPELYALGSTDHDALTSLGQLMALFHEPTRQRGASRRSKRVARLEAFLGRTFGD